MEHEIKIIASNIKEFKQIEDALNSISSKIQGCILSATIDNTHLKDHPNCIVLCEMEVHNNTTTYQKFLPNNVSNVIWINDYKRLMVYCEPFIFRIKVAEKMSFNLTFL